MLLFDFLESLLLSANHATVFLTPKILRHFAHTNLSDGIFRCHPLDMKHLNLSEFGDEFFGFVSFLAISAILSYNA